VPTSHEDESGRFATALRWTALGARIGFTVSLSLVAADVASQFPQPDRQAIVFGLAGGTAALLVWRLWGWLLKRVGIS
jgi:hypothetical protein